MGSVWDCRLRSAMGDRERRLGIAVLDLVFMGDLDRRVFSLALVPLLDLAGGGGEGVGEI